MSRVAKPRKSKRAPSIEKQRDAYIRSQSRQKHALNTTTTKLAEDVARIDWHRKVT